MLSACGSGHGSSDTSTQNASAPTGGADTSADGSNTATDGSSPTAGAGTDTSGSSNATPGASGSTSDSGTTSNSRSTTDPSAGSGTSGGANDPGQNGSNGGSSASDVNTAPTMQAADSQIQLAWPAVTGAEGYHVYYSTQSSFDPAQAVLLNSSVGVITGTTAIVTGLSNGTTYYSWVAPMTSGAEGTLTSLGDATPAAGGLVLQADQIQPAVNAVEVNPTTAIRIPFGSPLAPASVTAQSVKVEVNGAAQDVQTTLADADQTIVITPTSGTWQTGTTFTVTLTSNLQSTGGDPLPHALSYSFTTLNTSSLVAWWEFDNALTDLSGNGHTIDTNHGVTFASADNLHHSGTHAAYFDGASYMVLNDSTFNLGGQFAVAFWVYIPTLHSDINTVLSNASANTQTSGFKVGINSWQNLDKRVILEGGNGTQGGKALTATNFVQDGHWYHFAYNVDKTANLPNGKHVQIFFNGVEAGVSYDDNGTSAASMGTMDWTPMKTTGPLYFGAMVGGYYRLNGAYIDDLRIYNRPLSADEVINIAR